MIATIIKAEPHTTARGNQVVRLTVLDDTEWTHVMYFSLDALHGLDMLSVQTRIPFIRKPLYSNFNIAKLVGKIISVNREKLRFRDKLYDRLLLDMRYAMRMQCLKSGLGYLDLQS